MHSSPTSSPPPHVQMLELATGHFRSQALCVAAKLGIADLLKDGPKSVDELSRATHAHAGALYRLLRALASIGVFAEQADGRFALTPLAATLQSDSPNNIRAALLLAGGAFHWNTWSDLEHSIMTGEVAFEHVHGQRFFDYLTQHPDAGATFDAWMTRLSQLQLPVLVKSYEFAAFKTIVDVGGGHGALLNAIIAANPALTGILYDMPAVVAGAKLGERCRGIGGDMFRDVPAGGDLYLLKTVIHDWDDEHSLRILRNCRAAMSGHARLLLIESVVPPGNEPHNAKWMDLNMLVLNHGGKERTEAEFRTLLTAAGFKLTRILPTPLPLSLIEAHGS